MTVNHQASPAQQCYCYYYYSQHLLMLLMMMIYLILSLLISAMMNVYNATTKLKER